MRLVHARGRFMQEAVPERHGAMAAVLGCERDRGRRGLRGWRPRETGRVVTPANYNAPGADRDRGRRGRRRGRLRAGAGARREAHDSARRVGALPLRADGAGRREARARARARALRRRPAAGRDQRRGGAELAAAARFPALLARAGHRAGALHRDGPADGRRSASTRAARDRPGTRARRAGRAHRPRASRARTSPARRRSTAAETFVAGAKHERTRSASKDGERPMSLEERVAEIIVEQLGVKPAEIVPGRLVHRRSRRGLARHRRARDGDGGGVRRRDPGRRRRPASRRIGDAVAYLQERLEGVDAAIRASSAAASS